MEVGLIGLGVMGRNLALNMANNGWKVSVYNRLKKDSKENVVETFINGAAKGKDMIGFTDLGKFVESLEKPRKIMLMVSAGSAVDSVIEGLLPFLDKGDIIIDGGNSNFLDTNRRVKDLESRGFFMVGSGVSGGEEGALNGASIMPGGSKEAWEAVKPILTSIAAKAEDGEACCEWIGPEGSGHFVKMIHNGIEYGDMQLIAEAYWVMKQLGKMSNKQMHEVFSQWNKEKLQSYLIEITAKILDHKSSDGTYTLDNILDTSGQKGTGKWSVINAMELGMPLGLIATAVFERNISATKEIRVKTAEHYPIQEAEIENNKELIEEMEAALYASKLVSYAQGFAVLKSASDQYNWNLDLAEVAKLWRAGCIIRSTFLNDIAEAFKNNSSLENLLLSPFFEKEMKAIIPQWRKLVVRSLEHNISIPAFSAALNYFYSLSSADLPANMIQAQRDFFGAHTFERRGQERGKFFHEDWY